jgi:two-component system chemotaxis response regulator CheB
MSGLEAVEHVMSVRPLPILVLSSHVGLERAAAVLAAGALDAVRKDQLDLLDPQGPDAVALRRRLRVLAGARVIRHPRAQLRIPAAVGGSIGRTVAAIGVIASTGGPPALSTLLGALPARFAVPILVVQHIANGFTEGLARWLDQTVPLPVALAGDGQRLAPGIWIAPEGAHLVVRPGSRLGLDTKTAAGAHRPSGDVLLTSMAESLGRLAAGVVLTGMGRDGALGLGRIARAGGLTIAQDAPTSAVFGMPRAAAEAGAEAVLPLGEIAGRLLALRPVEESV